MTSSIAHHMMMEGEINGALHTLKSIRKRHPSLDDQLYEQVDLLLKELDVHLAKAKVQISTINKNFEATTIDL